MYMCTLYLCSVICLLVASKKILDNMEIRQIRDGELEQLHSLWLEGFPGTNWPPVEFLKIRRTQNPELLIGCFDKDELIAAVSGFRYTGTYKTKADMETNKPEGKYVCIHTLNVKKDKQNQGIGTNLLKLYINHVRETMPDIEGIGLRSYEDKLQFYVKAGFKVKRQISPELVEDGPNPRPLYDLEMDI